MPINCANRAACSRFVGRADESRTLAAALERARAGHGQVVGVVGEAGVGKSRLCHEFVERRRHEGVPVYQAHCPAHGLNIPLIPILDLYRNYFGITGLDSPAQARQKITGPLVLLVPEAIQDLLESLLGRDASPSDLVQRIMGWTGGNPFYTEELVRELIEARSLTGTASAYQLMTDVNALQIPTNVRAVLAARIDRLDEREKQVLQAAAVIGKDFAEPVLRRVVAALSQALTEAELGAVCGRLTDGNSSTPKRSIRWPNTLSSIPSPTRLR